jgi:hypothetical protein
MSFLNTMPTDVVKKSFGIIVAFAKIAPLQPCLRKELFAALSRI